MTQDDKPRSDSTSSAEGTDVPKKGKWYGDGVFTKVTKRGETFYITYGFAGRMRKELVVDTLGVYGDEEAARKLLEKRRAESRAKTFVPPKSKRELSEERKQRETTFAQHAAQVDRVYKGKRDTRRSGFFSATLVVLNRHFGTKRLRDISPRDVDGYVAARSAEFRERWRRDISGSTLRKELCALGLMFRFARRWKLIDSIPTDDIDRPRESKPKERFLTHEEWDKLDAELSEWMRPLCFVALRTALRLKEVTGLRWGDIQWDDERKQGQLRMTGDNKTASTDPGFFGEDVHAVFEELRGDRVPAATDYIFGGPDGKPIATEERRRWVAGQFKQAARRAGLYGREMKRRDRVTFHTLRHTCATWMHAAHVDPFTAMTILRHKSLGMTRNYTQVSQDKVRTAVNKVVPFRRTAQAS